MRRWGSWAREPEARLDHCAKRLRRTGRLCRPYQRPQVACGGVRRRTSMGSARHGPQINCLPRTQGADRRLRRDTGIVHNAEQDFLLHRVGHQTTYRQPDQRPCPAGSRHSNRTPRPARSRETHSVLTRRPAGGRPPLGIEFVISVVDVGGGQLVDIVAGLAVVNRGSGHAPPRELRAPSSPTPTWIPRAPTRRSSSVAPGAIRSPIPSLPSSRPTTASRRRGDGPPRHAGHRTAPRCSMGVAGWPPWPKGRLGEKRLGEKRGRGSRTPPRRSPQTRGDVAVAWQRKRRPASSTATRTRAWPPALRSRRERGRCRRGPAGDPRHGSVLSGTSGLVGGASEGALPASTAGHRGPRPSENPLLPGRIEANVSDDQHATSELPGSNPRGPHHPSSRVCWRQARRQRLGEPMGVHQEDNGSSDVAP